MKKDTKIPTLFKLIEERRKKAAKIGKQETGKPDMTAGVNEALDKYELKAK